LWKFEFFVTGGCTQALGLKIRLTRRPLTAPPSSARRGPRVYSILGRAKPALRQGFAFGKTLERAIRRAAHARGRGLRAAQALGLKIRLTRRPLTTTDFTRSL